MVLNDWKDKVMGMFSHKVGTGTHRPDGGTSCYRPLKRRTAQERESDRLLLTRKRRLVLFRRKSYRRLFWKLKKSVFSFLTFFVKKENVKQLLFAKYQLLPEPGRLERRKNWRRNAERTIHKLLACECRGEPGMSDVMENRQSGL